MWLSFAHPYVIPNGIGIESPYHFFALAAEGERERYHLHRETTYPTFRFLHNLHEHTAIIHTKGKVLYRNIALLLP